jgi:hypothetical protein
MKKQITIVVDEETTTMHLLNSQDYDVYQTNEDLFTMIKHEEKQPPLKD